MSDRSAENPTSVLPSRRANAELRSLLLYHFCKLRLSAVALSAAAFTRHLQRAFALYKAKLGDSAPSEESFFEALHGPDSFLAWACLEGDARAWEALFAARVSRSEALLVDALRARAVRLFPRDAERQEEVVADFWGFLLTGEREGATPVLARYDGQRPLVPWLIRVFQNRHLSELRHGPGAAALADDEPDVRVPDLPSADARWHEEFRIAAHEWLNGLSEQDVLLLGLRLRYRLSQRETATMLGIHEGNVSRQTAKLRDQCLAQLGRHLQEEGWTGDDLSTFILTEMDSLLLDEPRLSADRLAALLSAREAKRGAHSAQGKTRSSKRETHDVEEKENSP
jgi:RNA polymerase sigma factor (sigma-70 family)